MCPIFTIANTIQTGPLPGWWVQKSREVGLPRLSWMMIFSYETQDEYEKLRSRFFKAMKQWTGKIFIFYLVIDYCWMSKGSILLRSPGLKALDLICDTQRVLGVTLRSAFDSWFRSYTRYCFWLSLRSQRGLVESLRPVRPTRPYGLLWRFSTD